MTVTFRAAAGLRGRLVPPPDKSITHRALMLAAVASGKSLVRNALHTGDCVSTRRCLEALGVPVREERGAPYRVSLRIEGRGLYGFREPRDVLDAGNSGTTMRLLSGLLAGQNLYAVMSGDTSLCSRPMLRIVEPLRAMGADIRGREDGRFPPLTFLAGAGSLRPLEYRLPVASAQVKSALLLAALRARGTTRIGGAVGSRDHTERLFRFLSLPLTQEGGWLTVGSDAVVPAFDLTVPGDISSAAFFITAALLGGRELRVEDCGLNPSRLGFLEVLKRMGAAFRFEQQQESGAEPRGAIQVSPAALRGVEVDREEIPFLIDELPLLAVLAAFAQGVTRVRGAQELRHKESDRLEAVARLMSSMGGSLELQEDGFALQGPQRLHPGRIDCRGDQRIAMAGAVLAAGIPEGITVDGFEAAEVSFPGFIEMFRSLGGEAG
jgi:3-phosphoshikimate 1-carboxyvinyltransferase